MSPYNNQSVVCSRCATVMLPGAHICSTCCAPLEAEAPKGAPIAAAVPGAAAEGEAGVFSSWPFGAADAEAAAQVAANSAATVAAAGVRHQLERFSAPAPAPASSETFTTAQTATHVMPTLPAQRRATEPATEPAPVADDSESVPAWGPNPFLAAARIQHAREEAAAEAYSG